MVETTVVRTIRVKGTSEGIDKLTGDLTKLAGAQENVAVVSEQSARRSLSVEAAYKRMIMQVDENARAQDRMAKATKVADQALQQGLINPAQHAQSLQLITQRYGNVIDATDKFAKSSGLARHELINLGRQAQDVGVSLLSGQSPFMVLAQQGSQIADVFISSGKSVGAFFTQAMTWAAGFAKTTAGIATGVVAVGAAAGFAAYQFLKASTTVEEALEEQNRLLKEGKTLIDQRTSAEAKAQLQSRDLTEFEIKRNLLDLQRKLNQEARGAVIGAAAQPRGMLDIRGMFSQEAPAMTPGMDKVINAAVKLKEAQAAGLPALKEYTAELGRIGTAHPELAKTVEDLIKLARTGIEIEQAEMRLKAISDALKGVATNAQLAAVGLGSIAQFKLNNLQAKQAEEATERQAVATLKIAEAYPGMSVEVAKQLNALNSQLPVVQALTGAAQIEAQYYATITAKLAEGKTLVEATAIAEAKRALSVAQVNAEADRQLKTLQDQYQLIRATSEEERGRIEAAQEYQRLLDAGVDSQKAGNIAAQMQANARATLDARDATVSWSVANDEASKSAARLAVLAGDAFANAKAAIEAAIDAVREFNKFIPFATKGLYDLGYAMSYVQGKSLFMSNQGGTSQFNPAGYTSSSGGASSGRNLGGVGGGVAQGGYRSGEGVNVRQLTLEEIGNSKFGPGRFNITGQTVSGNAEYFMENFYNFIARQGYSPGQSAFGAASRYINEFATSVNSEQIQQQIQRMMTLMSEEDKKRTLEMNIAKLSRDPASLGRDELLQSLNEQLKQLTEATDENTNALNAQLDPLYSQGHEFINNLKIGYYKAATGLTGVVTGTGGPDSTPVHMMLTPGETVHVLPPEWARGRAVSNDNSRNVTQNITQNINVVEAQPVDRLTARQRAQGFIAAATRAVGA